MNAVCLKFISIFKLLAFVVDLKLISLQAARNNYQDLIAITVEMNRHLILKFIEVRKYNTIALCKSTLKLNHHFNQ